MIHLIIPRERVTSLLLSAGYVNHITQHEGQIVHGYKKDFDSTHRWHAVEKGNSIEIHIDRTINGFHKLVSYQGKEKHERLRIMQIYNSLYPKEKKPDDAIVKMKIKKGGEFAPNLMELQKRHKTPSPTLKEFVSHLEGVIIDE